MFFVFGGCNLCVLLGFMSAFLFACLRLGSLRISGAFVPGGRMVRTIVYSVSFCSCRYQ